MSSAVAGASVASLPSPIRVDAMTLSIEVHELDGTRYQLLPEGRVTAAHQPALIAFAAHAGRSRLVLRARGFCAGPFSAQLELAGKRVGAVAQGVVTSTAGEFDLELSVNAEDIPPVQGEGLHKVAIVLSNGRTLTVTHAKIIAVPGPAPGLRSFDVSDVTDTLLYDAPPRKGVDLSNPEEGFWLGSGRFHLRARAEWTRASGGDGALSWRLDPAPMSVSHDQRAHGDERDALYEDPSLRKGESTFSEAGFVFDTSHPDHRGKVSAAGTDIHVPTRGRARTRVWWTTVSLGVAKRVLASTA